MKEPESAISVDQLERHVRSWLVVTQIGQRSRAIQENYKLFTGKLLWFLKDRECGVPELREFFAYLTTAHRMATSTWRSCKSCGPPSTEHRPDWQVISARRSQRVICGLF